jgi:uncharacterized protein YcnI
MQVRGLASSLGLVAIVLVASAHVTIQPRQVAAGTRYGEFAVRVPTEKPVPTIKIRVEFPPGLRVARLKAKPGWTAALERDSAKIITGVTWTGGKIGPDEYEDFYFSGNVTAAAGDTLMVRAWQTYEGGEIVEWTDTVDPRAARPAARVVVTGQPSGLAAMPVGTWLGGTALLLAFIALTLAMRKNRSAEVTHA